MQDALPNCGLIFDECQAPITFHVAVKRRVPTLGGSQFERTWHHAVRAPAVEPAGLVLPPGHGRTSAMRIVLIAAMTRDRLIGKEGGLPWHLPADLKHFKRTTLGHAVIMGRKTFDSCGNRPLPDRRNIVISRSASNLAHNATLPTGGGGTSVDTVPDLDTALDLCRRRNEDIAFVVGGAQIYALALPLADEMIITYVAVENPSGDTYFPEWNPADWEEEAFSGDPTLDIRRYRRKA